MYNLCVLTIPARKYYYMYKVLISNGGLYKHEDLTLLGNPCVSECTSVNAVTCVTDFHFLQCVLKQTLV